MLDTAERPEPLAGRYSIRREPENVLLAGDQALLTDFGIARAASLDAGAETLTAVGTTLGTPQYPE